MSKRKVVSLENATELNGGVKWKTARRCIAEPEVEITETETVDNEVIKVGMEAEAESGSDTEDDDRADSSTDAPPVAVTIN